MTPPYDVKCHKCGQPIRWTDSVRESAESGTCKACRPTLPIWVMKDWTVRAYTERGGFLSGNFYATRKEAVARAHLALERNPALVGCEVRGPQGETVRVARSKK